SCPSAVSSTARSSSRPTTGSTSRRCSNGSTRQTRACACSPSRHRPRSSPSTSSPSATTTCGRCPSHNAVPASSTRWPVPARRRELVGELEPYRKDALEGHPWAGWAEAMQASAGRMPGAQSRWNAGKQLAWEPLRPELVCEVAFDHLQGDRFRHATQFVRWRPDKPPAECRYDQLEETPPALLADLFGGR